MWGCSTLLIFPNSNRNLTVLQSVELASCSTLQTPPDSVGNLTDLQSPELRWSSTLQTLSKSWSRLVLHSADSPRFGWEPDGPSHVLLCRSSQTLLGTWPGLYLGRCFTLDTHSDSVGNLSDFDVACALQIFPDSAGNLTGLQSPYLRAVPLRWHSRVGWELYGTHKSLPGGCSTLHTSRFGWEFKGPPISFPDRVLHFAGAARVEWEPDAPPKCLLERMLHIAYTSRLYWELNGPPISLPERYSTL